MPGALMRSKSVFLTLTTPGAFMRSRSVTASLAISGAAAGSRVREATLLLPVIYVSILVCLSAPGVVLMPRLVILAMAIRLETLRYLEQE